MTMNTRRRPRRLDASWTQSAHGRTARGGSGQFTAIVTGIVSVALAIGFTSDMRTRWIWDVVPPPPRRIPTGARTGG